MEPLYPNQKRVVAPRGRAQGWETQQPLRERRNTQPRTLVRSSTRADSFARRAAACSAVSPGRSGDEVWDTLPLLLLAATTAQRFKAYARRAALCTGDAAGARPAGRAAGV